MVSDVISRLFFSESCLRNIVIHNFKPLYKSGGGEPVLYYFQKCKKKKIYADICLKAGLLSSSEVWRPLLPSLRACTGRRRLALSRSMANPWQCRAFCGDWDPQLPEWCNGGSNSRNVASLGLRARGCWFRYRPRLPFTGNATPFPFGH